MENIEKLTLPEKPELPPKRIGNINVFVPRQRPHSEPVFNPNTNKKLGPVPLPRPRGLHQKRENAVSLDLESLLKGRNVLQLNEDTKVVKNHFHSSDLYGPTVNIEKAENESALKKTELFQLPQAHLPLKKRSVSESSQVNGEANIVNWQPNKNNKPLHVSDNIVSQLKGDLDKNLNSLFPRSNLNKLKSISSPVLCSKHEEEDFKRSLCKTDEITIKTDKGGKDLTDGFFNGIKTSGIKKWQSFGVGRKKTRNVMKITAPIRNRSGTDPISETINEFEEYSDLHQEDGTELFNHVLVVSLKEDNNLKLTPYISFQFPPKIDENKENDQIMQSIPQFCFPDLTVANNFGYKQSENFSFVLTDVDGKRNYGFCRLIQISSSKFPEVYCIISPHGLFAMYSQILEEVETQRMISNTAVFSFLKAVLSHSLPKPASFITVSFFTSDGASNVKKVTLKRPGDSAIHEHVDLSVLFSTLPISLIIELLSCLLQESKVILCSNSLSLLSSCCHGLISLMYPFTWQHTYIPVLPINLVDIVCLPTPYLIGVLPKSIDAMEELPLDEVTVANLESKEIMKQFHHDNLKQLPKQIKDEVKDTLEEIMQVSQKTKNFGELEQAARNQVITEVFIHSYIRLIGHFESYFSMDESSTPVIKGKPFYKASNTREQKKFLKVFMNTQAFQQFTISRKLNGPSQGLFENSFAEWKKKRIDTGKNNLKDILHAFKRKLHL